MSCDRPAVRAMAGYTASRAFPDPEASLDGHCIEWSVSLEQLGDRQLRELWWSRKFGKEPPGSGDLTSLTTEPN